MDILYQLRAAADQGDEYREFNRRIVATNYEVLGVRMPALRALAKRIASGPEVSNFFTQVSKNLTLSAQAEILYEEVMLAGLVLAARARKMPLEEVLGHLDRLIPMFDSWAHVDVIVSGFKIFRRHQSEVLSHFLPLKNHPDEMSKRTFVILLMDYFLDDEHIESTLKHLTEVPQGQYYVDMALAWALAEALVKHWDTALPLLQTPVFSRFVHNKAIQKARESYRISPERKEHLNSLKLKAS